MANVEDRLTCSKHLNSICPPSEYQLHFVRAFMYGVSNLQSDHSAT